MNVKNIYNTNRKYCLKFTQNIPRSITVKYQKLTKESL